MYPTNSRPDPENNRGIFSIFAEQFKEAKSAFHTLVWWRQAIVVISSIVGAIFLLVGAFPAFCWTAKILQRGQNSEADKTAKTVRPHFGHDKDLSATTFKTQAAAATNTKSLGFPPVDIFGEAEWKSHFGNIKNVPKVPSTIKATLNKDCRHFPGKKVWETHALVLIPEKIQLEREKQERFVNLRFLKEIGSRSSYNIPLEMPGFFNSDEWDYSLPSYWCLITKDTLNLGKHTAGIVKPPEGYEFPDVREIAIYLFTQYVRSGEYNFGPALAEVGDYDKCSNMWRTYTNYNFDNKQKEPFTTGVNPYKPKDGISVLLPENSTGYGSALVQRFKNK